MYHRYVICLNPSSVLFSDPPLLSITPPRLLLRRTSHAQGAGSSVGAEWSGRGALWAHSCRGGHLASRKCSPHADKLCRPQGTSALSHWHGRRGLSRTLAGYATGVECMEKSGLRVDTLACRRKQAFGLFLLRLHQLHDTQLGNVHHPIVRDFGSVWVLKINFT